MFFLNDAFRSIFSERIANTQTAYKYEQTRCYGASALPLPPYPATEGWRNPIIGYLYLKQTRTMCQTSSHPCCFAGVYFQIIFIRVFSHVNPRSFNYFTQKICRSVVQDIKRGFHLLDKVCRGERLSILRANFKNVRRNFVCTLNPSNPTAYFVA